MDETTERFLRTEAIFHQILAVPAHERDAWIEAQSGGDAELANELRSLLDAYEAEAQVTESLHQEPQASLEDQPRRQRIGAYQLDRLLGRGGMGAVYLAHRADGQFDQVVAVKLIDLPLATEIFRERFRQERQILAGLQHPYIARLMDGGVTEYGDLYLAMEYVDGMPIHRYCEQHKLSESARLRLFTQVCEAVQFAHQNFVVHRDLKPDNILVGEDGSPRLLDFGTAKLLSPDLSNQGAGLTREGYLSFTPHYASPEQVLGNPITTASDTYSLGVLLYLLLTGTQPYEMKELSTGEMVRVVCEEAPRKPALATGKRLDPDLEAILLKALRKDPLERYLTAEQLASDIHAYLHGMPVAARRGSFRYRAIKFIRRNRLALAAALLLALSIFGGVVGIAWQARIANQERRKAEARSADLRQLSNSLLSELDEAIQQLPGSTGIQKLLVTRVLEHLDRMAKDAGGDRQAQLDLVDAYARLANIQGNTYTQNLGDTAGALASIEKAIALARPWAPEQSKDRDALRALAEAQMFRSEILFDTPRMDEAVADMRASIHNYEQAILLPGVTATQICEVATAYGILGDELGQGGNQSLHDLSGAMVAFRKDIDLVDRALRIDPNLMRARRALAIGQMKLGEAESETDPAQALKDFQISLQLADALPPKEQESLRMIRVRDSILTNEANIFVELGRYTEANALYGEVTRKVEQLSAADPQDLRALFDLQTALNQQAASYEAAAGSDAAGAAASRHANLAAAVNYLAQEVEVLKRMLKADPSNEEYTPVLADAEVRLGSYRSTLHLPADSTAIAKAGLATMRKLAESDQASPGILDQTANNFLEVEPASLKDPQFAVACAERAAKLSQSKTPKILLTLAQAYRAASQYDRSRTIANTGLALLPVIAPGATKPDIRILLEAQTRRGK